MVKIRETLPRNLKSCARSSTKIVKNDFSVSPFARCDPLEFSLFRDSKKHHFAWSGTDIAEPLYSHNIKMAMYIDISI